MFDLFTKTSTRLYYNFLVTGEMGSGKSTLLKKQLKDNAAKGNFVRTFDVSGEFTLLTKTLGGKVIKMDGSNGILNPLEILRAGDNENISFTRHISKVSTFYKLLVGGKVEAEEIVEFEEMLRELYKEFGFDNDYTEFRIQRGGCPDGEKAGSFDRMSEGMRHRELRSAGREAKGYEQRRHRNYIKNRKLEHVVVR